MDLLSLLSTLPDWNYYYISLYPDFGVGVMDHTQVLRLMSQAAYISAIYIISSYEILASFNLYLVPYCVSTMLVHKCIFLSSSIYFSL